MKPILFKIPEAAHYLAVGRSTLYLLVRTGEIRPVHIGRAIRIPASELDRWLEAKLEERADA